MTIDIVDTAAGLAADSPIAALRRQREAFVRYTQGSSEVLIAPADPGGVSLVERAAAALRVASGSGRGSADHPSPPRATAADPPP